MTYSASQKIQHSKSPVQRTTASFSLAKQSLFIVRTSQDKHTARAKIEIIHVEACVGCTRNHTALKG